MINSIISWLKTKVIVILLILLGVSVVLNVYLYKGLVINWYTTNNTQSFSNSYSSSAAINETLVNDYYHMAGKWALNKKVCITEDEAVEFMKTLNPIQYKFTKQLVTSNKLEIVLVYPSIADTEKVTHKEGSLVTETTKGVMK